MKRLAPISGAPRSSDISLTPKLLADAVDSSTTLHVVPETKQAGCDFEVRPKIERRLRARAGGHLARRSDVIIRLRSTAALAHERTCLIHPKAQ